MICRNFRTLLRDGSQYGIHLQYRVQPNPEGIAQAFLLGEEFMRDVALRAGVGRQHFLRA